VIAEATQSMHAFDLMPKERAIKLYLFDQLLL